MPLGDIQHCLEMFFVLAVEEGVLPVFGESRSLESPYQKWDLVTAFCRAQQPASWTLLCDSYNWSAMSRQHAGVEFKADFLFVLV